MGVIKMIFNRLLNKLIGGNKFDSNLRYFRVIQDDGVQYDIEMDKKYVPQQIASWVYYNIKFTEITAKDYYKNISKKQSLKKYV